MPITMYDKKKFNELKTEVLTKWSEDRIKFDEINVLVDEISDISDTIDRVHNYYGKIAIDIMVNQGSETFTYRLMDEAMLEGHVFKIDELRDLFKIYPDCSQLDIVNSETKVPREKLAKLAKLKKQEAIDSNEPALLVRFYDDIARKYGSTTSQTLVGDTELDYLKPVCNILKQVIAITHFDSCNKTDVIDVKDIEIYVNDEIERGSRPDEYVTVTTLGEDIINVSTTLKLDDAVAFCQNQLLTKKG